MKKQTKSRLQISLQSLGIISLMFFAMAFACKDDNGGRTDTDSGGRRDTSGTTTGGGKCSTEAEFQNVIFKTFHLNTFNEPYGQYKEPEINFQTFDISNPTSYISTDAYNLVKVDTAYPVTTSYTTRFYRHNGVKDINEIWEYDWQSNFMCYINHRSECTCDRKKYEASQNARITPADE
jgi:hypothetical protein